MYWRVIANPEAGGGRTRRLLPALRRALSDPRLCASTDGVELSVSSSSEHATELARSAYARGQGVVACGGDGTVACLAEPAVDATGVLAIVPTGSGNDLARYLGLEPRRPLDALSTLVDGHHRTVDLGRAGDRLFTTVAGSGFDAEANRWANGVERLRGTALYVAAVIRTLRMYEPHRFRLTVDDGPPRDLEAWMVVAANTPSYGGGMRIAPDARTDDGVLDLTIVHGTVSRGGFLRAFPRVFRGTHLSHPAVETLRARSVVFGSLDDSVPMELWASGERVGRLPQSVESVPAALTVLVPDGAPTTG